MRRRAAASPASGIPDPLPSPEHHMAGEEYGLQHRGAIPRLAAAPSGIPAAQTKSWGWPSVHGMAARCEEAASPDCPHSVRLTGTQPSALQQRYGCHSSAAAVRSAGHSAASVRGCPAARVQRSTRQLRHSVAPRIGMGSYPWQRGPEGIRAPPGPRPHAASRVSPRRARHPRPGARPPQPLLRGALHRPPRPPPERRGQPR